MPRYYYHADRRTSLKPGQVISLTCNRTDLAQFNTDRAHFLSALLPDGITQHGWGYLIDDHRQPPHEDTNGMIEILAEWIRQARYPHRPSRLQSFFAWRSLADARAFMQDSILAQSAGTLPHSTIWEVEADEPVFESDMNRLSLGNCWLDAMMFLDCYWRQDYTPKPRVEVLLTPPIRIIRSAS